MRLRLEQVRIAAMLIGALFLSIPLSHAQEPSFSSAPNDAAGDETRPNDNTAGVALPSPQPSAQTPTPAATPETELWKRDTLTGDWDGTRTKWTEKGVDLEFKISQYYQGVASGGIDESSVSNAKNQTVSKFDLGKMLGWKYWSAELTTEVRYGAPVLGGVGTINPVNTAMLIPADRGTVFAVTAANVTRLFPVDLKKGNLFALTVGRLNLIDSIDEDFFGGSGTERFLNMAQIGPLTVLRQVPLITNGAIFAYVKGGEPFFTLALLDPNDHSTTTGIPDMFTDGVTFSPGINFHTRYFKKSAKHSFGAAITTKAYTPFDAIRQVIVPGPAINPIQPKRGSWSVNYEFRQYLVERGHKDGWGLFTQVAFADKETSPVTNFFDIGLGGNGLFKSRKDDEFGVSYAYTNLSSVLKHNINLLTIREQRPLAEHQFEVFYNFHIAPWLRLTGDLQIIRPTRLTASTAVVPGARLEIVF